MKKFFLFFILCSLFKGTYGQERLNYNEKLYYTCKIWGFLKYHHPEVMSGKYDWDKELFKILKITRETSTKDELNEIFYDWIINLGKIKNGTGFQIIDSSLYKQLPNYSWLKNESEFGIELSSLLQNILNAKRNAKNYYITQNKCTQATIFEKENDYLNIGYDNQDYMLLALYRYWNAIEYFYPYKNNMNNNWDSILSKYIPIFKEINCDTKYYDAISCLVSEISDSHAYAYTDNMNCAWEALRDLNLNGNKKVSVYLDYVENQITVTNFFDGKFENCELKIGDIILEENNVGMQDKISQIINRFSFSNNESLGWSLNLCLLTSNEDFIKLKIKRGDSIFVKNIECESLSNYNNKFIINADYINRLKSLKDDNIAYINTESVSKSEIKKLEVEKKDNQIKGIIIDIRGYPQYWVYRKLGSLFLNSSKEFVKLSKPKISMPGVFKMGDGTTLKGYAANKYIGKIILLVNNDTFSHGEFATMALQSIDGVITIGSKTAGTDGDITKLPLPNGIKTNFSSLGVYYPDGGETQRIGIRIDEIVKPTIKGIREGRDEILERAVEIINSK